MTSTIESQLVDLAADFLKLDRAELTLDSAVGDFPQWDSFAHVNLLTEIEGRFGFAFDMDDILAIQTLGDILGVVRRHAEGAQVR